MHGLIAMGVGLAYVAGFIAFFFAAVIVDDDSFSTRAKALSGVVVLVLTWLFCQLT